MISQELQLSSVPMEQDMLLLQNFISTAALHVPLDC